MGFCAVNLFGMVEISPITQLGYDSWSRSIIPYIPISYINKLSHKKKKTLFHIYDWIYYMILNDRLIIHESSIILEELQQPHGVTSLEWWWMQGESARHMYIVYIFWNSNNVIYEQTLHFCCKKIHLYLSLMLSLSLYFWK